MRFRIIFSFVFYIIVYSSFSQTKHSTNHRPRYYASIQEKSDKIERGLLVRLEDSSAILYPGKWKRFRKSVINDSVVIAYSQILKIKLKKKNGLLKGLLIGGVIGFAPAFFGEGGSYVAAFSLPIGIITGAIIGSTSHRKFFINGNYASFNKMKKKIQ